MSRYSATGAAWAAQRRRVLDRDGWRCSYCGTALAGADATVDHVVPVSRDPDATHPDHGLVAACRTCNGTKGASLLRRLDYAAPQWLPKGLPRR